MGDPFYQAVRRARALTDPTGLTDLVANDAERRALFGYVGAAGVNDDLRATRGNLDALPEDTLADVRLLDAVLTKNRTLHDIVVYRGGLNGLPRNRSRWVGHLIRDRAYLSTSRFLGVAARFAEDMRQSSQCPVILRVRVPAGTPAVDLDSLTIDNVFVRREGEVLLPRDTPIRITAVQDNDGELIAEGVVLTHEHTRGCVIGCPSTE